jgi:hypothetical protein
MQRGLIFLLGLLFFYYSYVSYGYAVGNEKYININRGQETTFAHKNLLYNKIFGVSIETGMGFTSVNKLAQNLNNTPIFRNVNQPPFCASLYGLRIFFNSGSRWLAQLGITGASHSVIVGAANETAIGEARLKFFGGRLALGYALLTRPLPLVQGFWEGRMPFWQLYPFAAFNIGRQSLQIFNYTSEVERIGQTEKAPVFPATPLNLGSVSFQTEFGVGAVFYTHNKSGIHLGLELGGILTPFASAWNDSEASGNSVDLPNRLMNGAFLRVSLGGFWANMNPNN